MKDPNFLEIKKHALEVRNSYAERSQTGKINILNIGRPGTGKTRLALYSPKPVHIDVFDRGGEKTEVLQPLIERGEIIVDTSFQRDSWKDPYAFRSWEAKIEKRIRMGYFDCIGTYMLDSATTFADSMIYAILKKGGDKRGSRQGQLPERQDYHMQQYTMVDYFNLLMDLPCHVIVNGHVVILQEGGDSKDRYADTGTYETGILLAGKASFKTPLAFDEKYIARYIGNRYVLQTKTDGKWHAETRVGETKFEQFEEPNLYKLLEKAGLDFADKPLLSELVAKEVTT